MLITDEALGNNDNVRHLMYQASSIVQSRRSELVKIGTQLAKASTSGNAAAKAVGTALEVGSYAKEATEAPTYFCLQLEKKLAEMEEHLPSLAELLRLRLVLRDNNGDLLSVAKAQQILQLATSTSSNTTSKEQQTKALLALDLTRANHSKSSAAASSSIAVPAEYSKPSSIPEQLRHNSSNQLKIKQGLLVLQRALAKDYAGAINNLAEALANQVKADILTLLKNGVLNPLLSPLVSKAAEGALSKVGEIVESITGSILDNSGLFEIEGVSAGDEPLTLRE